MSARPCGSNVSYFEGEEADDDAEEEEDESKEREDCEAEDEDEGDEEGEALKRERSAISCLAHMPIQTRNRILEEKKFCDSGASANGKARV